ncbi:MAG: hypothetical protein V4793_15925 [Paraburkholderia tropica]|uniref:Permease n=1 Tax=Paraburkholderia tropica TaxID=92647 RepID=A0ABX5MD57_9BURK|nr:hypothetical protein [Paraburkholderia tropica]MBB3004684.1 hypothetical protein [Paraburkholderia tropica]MBB6323482.1 hypothetical protein [Paraburkholderia tropica]PXX03456.1 hypothetical protein C7400_1497 [Paraburkholderia tropica]PZW69375.1 hypothetical protein C7399_1497 [Paraburkholderia tropica]QNB17383.1 hypothetical protein G5S35_37920 [Paraburkholderia tropica]
MLGWIWVNAGVAIIAPIVGLGVVLLVHLLAGGDGGLSKDIIDRIKLVAPFRDGQLGYIAVGWAVAAYHDLHEWQSGKISVDWVSDVDIALFLLGGLAGLVAAFGAVSPLKPLAVGATRPRLFSRAGFKRYILAIASIVLSVLVLCIMIFVRLKTTGKI